MDAITTTYMQCPQCGRKALSVATRCPHCGVAFPSRPLQRSAPGDRRALLRPVLAVSGVLVLGALLAVVLPRLASKAAIPARGALPRETSPILSEPGGATSADAAVEGVRSGGDAAPQATALRAVATAPVGPAAAGPPTRRVARTWVNVRGGRSRGAPVVLVLNPGDTVQVDSLSRGWYRVLIDGRAAGYVYRSNLDPVPPAR